MNRRARAVMALAVSLAMVTVSACGGDDDGGNSGSGQQAGSGEAKALMGGPKGVSWFGQLVAEDQGYWTDDGVKVELVEAGGSGAAMQQLIAGNGTVAWSTAAAALIAYDKDPGVRALGCAEQESIESVRVLADSDIQNASQLDGKTVGIVETGGAGEPLVKASARSAGVDAKIVAVGDPGPTVVRSLENGRIAAFGGGLADMTILESLGTKLRDITPPQYRSIPGACMIVTEEALKDPKQREVAADLLRGWLKGVLYTLEKEEATLDLVCREAAAACKNREFVGTYLGGIVDRVRAHGDRPLLSSNPEGWKNTAEMLRQAGVVDREIDVNPLFASPEVEQVREEVYADLDQMRKDAAADAKAGSTGGS